MICPTTPKRLMVVIGHRVVVQLPERTLLRADAARKIAKMIHREGQIGQIRLANRLAVIVGLHRREKRQILLHPIRNAIQNARPLRHRRAPPAGAAACAASSASSTSSAWDRAIRQIT